MIDTVNFYFSIVFVLFYIINILYYIQQLISIKFNRENRLKIIFYIAMILLYVPLLIYTVIGAYIKYKLKS